MKRKLKFRAWNIPNKLMYLDIQKGILTEKDGKLCLGTSFDTICKDAGSEVMQYTGLKDKDGKEIYEGDIISQYGQNLYVGWNESQHRWTLYETDGKFKNAKYHLGQGDGDNKVIGNIYENPELLK